MNTETRYTTDDLRRLPTLCVGQADSLKIDNGKTRVWLCRCGIADGMPYDNAVTIEKLIDGQWTEVEQYEG